LQIGEELPIDEGQQVIAGHRGIVIELAVLALGRGPARPAVGFVEDARVFLSVQRCLGGPVLLQGVEIFQEQQPGGLLGVIQLAGATGIFPEDVINVFEGLFEHGLFISLCCRIGGHRISNRCWGKQKENRKAEFTRQEGVGRWA
jgi:hypothetical protein